MSLLTLEKKVNMLIADQQINDWFPEKEGFMGIEPRTLRAMRNEQKHNEGWKCLKSEKGTDKKGRVIRRNIIWNRTYLFNLFQQA